ncbi:WbqC family protein [Vibrio fluvialis]|uniref:WbqC family protein n=1 Tax=Vibrio fluvialis TaxID=676 RepID=UPI002572D241|nr:WbqC family protein [Vibrio fluvialis]BEI22389.1 WbqC family protein [Vibrio fluvialis]
MKLAVMQPYLFPYIGYYQLVNSVDKFVFYDDVSFIKGGYINRNRILVNGQAHLFSLPIIGASQNKLINELVFDRSIRKLLKTIEQSYKKAPYFSDVFPIIESVITGDDRSVLSITSASVQSVFDYLCIKREFLISSHLRNDKSASAKKRLIDMSKMLNCDVYINSPGGKNLYRKDYFENSGIRLEFLESEPVKYEQNSNVFTPNLSIIDVLMWNSKQEVTNMLGKCRSL